MSSQTDPAVRAGIVITAGDIGKQLSPGRHKIAAHEAAHIVAELALDGDPEQWEVFAGETEGFVRKIRAPGYEEPAPRSDDEQLASLDLVQDIVGLPPLDMRQTRRTARALLREHWIFHATITQIIERRIAADGEGWIRSDELNGLWLLYQRRKEYENALEANER